MSSWPNPAEDAALRSVSPPPLSGDFADRVLARLEARSEGPPEARPLRDRRGEWKRGRVILISGVAAGLLSVGAAASNLFGVLIRNVPVVGTWVEAVAPTKPKPKLVKERAPHAPTGVASKPVPVAEPVAAVSPEPALPPLPREVRREAAAERIAQALDRRDQRRRENGLPPKPPRLNPQMRERLKFLPPEERRALVRRVRDLRTEAAIARGESPPPPVRLQPRQLTPEQRERRREWRERTRAMREAQFSPPPEDLAPPSEGNPAPLR